MKSHELQIRIYYEDTDCGGVVYHANYLRYMERGRTEFARSLGIDLAAYQDQGLVFAVVDASIKYRRSAYYNDMLTVVTSVKEIASASMTFSYEIKRGDALLAEGEVKIACVKLGSGMPTRMPAGMVEALKA
ncbi:MAG: tol-pal system-associated acyl-CoA thioesterase [Chitinispirillia bacterium]|nr:tol-pal system-associated acyl-CoA thioesterase [Chitinispirillia bacterium]MCL2242410.1 tol-pal system-associated acyl-CoA thioesterase [Chitinispirillia bacterium]